MEDDVLEFTLKVHDQDPGDSTSVFVSARPALGTLYQTTRAADGSLSRGDVIPPVGGGAQLEQWAVAAEASSFWNSGDIYIPAQMIGPPNIFPLAVDTPGVWEPSEDGDWWFQWLQLEYATPVFANRLDIFECW